MKNMTIQDGPTHIVVMGVSGTGKTSVAQYLCDRFGWKFAEGDDLHPASNIEKMSAGIPLNDEDREPWLTIISDWMTEQAQSGESTVVTCSSLKKKYRDTLRQAEGRVIFLHLAGDFDTIAARMTARENHFMPTSLLESQFATLEVPGDDEEVITIDIAPAKDVVKENAAQAVADYLA